MKRIKISPTLLNSFGMYLDESLEWFDHDKLVETITKPFIKTDEMRYGEACHKLIEDYVPGEILNDPVVMITEDNKKVPLPLLDVRELLVFKTEHPNGVYEQRHRKTYQIGGYEVIVSMKIDMIEFNTIYDFKITGSSVKAETYLKAYQWKCYVDAMELPNFVYRVWQRRKSGLVPFEPIKCYRTDNTHQEVVDGLSMLINFLETESFINRFLYDD